MNKFFFSKKQRTIILLILVIASLPFSIMVNNLALIFFGINAVISFNWKEFYQRFVNRRILLIFTIPFLVNLLGLIGTNYLYEGLFTIEKSLSLFIIPIFFILIPHFDNNEIKLILRAFLFVCIITIVISTFQSFLNIYYNNSYYDISKITDRKYYYFTYEYLAGGIGMNPIYLSLYMNFALSIVAHDYFKCGLNKKNVFLIILFTAFNFLLLSKIGMAINISIILILIFNEAKTLSLFGRFVLIFLSCALLAVILNLKPIKERLNIDLKYSFVNEHISQWNGANLRAAIWACSFEVIQDHFWLGVGTGGEEQALISNYIKNDFKIAQRVQYNTHNQVLEYLVRVGMIGTIFFIFSFIMFPLYWAFKSKNFLYFTFIIIIILTAMTEVILARQKGVVFYSLFNMILINIPIKPNDP